MITNINTDEVWLDVETVAKLKGVTKRAVRLSIQKYEYRVENIRGGKSYKIKLSSLDETLQIKYIRDFCELINTENNIAELKVKQEKLIPEKQRKQALAKYDIVNNWLDFRSNLKTDKNKFKTDLKNIRSDKQFEILFNTGTLYPELFKTVGKISIGSLYRWKKLLGYNGDWTCLVGQYNYTTQKEYKTSLNEEQIKIFIQILLSPSAFSIGKSISLTKHILKERGYEILPKDVTFRRYANWFKGNNFDKWTLARHGEKALKDKVCPYIVRDASILKPAQVLVADGHTLNFQVINPFTGRPCRATLIGFLDWKSGGLVGYDIMLEECTQNIASALRNAILKMNHIPEYVYQDNGRAFKSKFFNGDKNFTELGFTGVYNKLGIKPIYATPYNAQSKVIERFFLEFQESFEKLIPSYIGTSIDKKPAYMMRNEKLHKQIHEKSEFIPSVEQAIQLIEKWLEYYHSKECPNVKGKTIKEVLNEIEKQNIDESLLDDLMMAQEIKTIGRNGIRFLKSDYFNDALYGIRDKVLIKYSLSDLSHIKVYTFKGEFLCRADKVTQTHPLAYQMGDIKDIEDYKQKIEKQHKLRKKTIKAIKEHFSVDDIDLIKDKLLETYTDETVVEEAPAEIEEVKKPKEKPQENYVQKRKRPMFKENYERYEWHMQNGCICPEDRQWLTNYIKSEEYRLLYEN